MTLILLLLLLLVILLYCYIVVVVVDTTPPDCDSSAPAPQLVAALVGATAMATWHAALFMEMEKVSSVPSHVLHAVQGQTLSLFDTFVTTGS